MALRRVPLVSAGLCRMTPEISRAQPPLLTPKSERPTERENSQLHRSGIESLLRRSSGALRVE